MRRLLALRPSPAMVVACVALIVALGGTGYAAITLPRNSVGTKQLRPNAVTGGKVRNGSLQARDFAASQLPRGPRGPQGPQGPAGDGGGAGAPPARSAFASRDIGSTPLPITPAGTEVEVLDLAVPAGSSGYVSSSGVVTVPAAGRLIATADLVIVSANPNLPNFTCRFALVPAGGAAKPFGASANTLIASNEYLIVPLTAGVDVDPGTYNVRVQCSGDGPSFTFHRGNLTVVATPR